MANAAELLDVLTEPTRREIVERLCRGSASVTDIARDMPITRSAVSQHLQLLKSVGLVVDHRAGTSRIYRVDPDALAIIASYFDAFWRRSLASFRRTAEHHAEGQP